MKPSFQIDSLNHLIYRKEDMYVWLEYQIIFFHTLPNKFEQFTRHSRPKKNVVLVIFFEPVSPMNYTF